MELSDRFMNALGAGDFDIFLSVGFHDSHDRKVHAFGEGLNGLRSKIFIVSV